MVSTAMADLSGEAAKLSFRVGSVNPTPIVAVFARPPVPGEAKTRLATSVGAEGAARLASAFFADTWAMVAALGWARPVLATTGDPAGLDATEVWQQGDGDLGARVERIVRRALDEAPWMIALGADSPGLPPARLEQARAAIEGGDLAPWDAAIVPADDGGFVLLALRTCAPGLFADLPWSRQDTCAAMCARIESVGMRLVRLEPWFDVDGPADLDRLRSLLRKDPESAPRSAALLL
jgi:rSAM/selenodomain-associated transferase 1